MRVSVASKMQRIEEKSIHKKIFYDMGVKDFLIKDKESYKY